MMTRQRSWRGYYDYGGGLITDWGVHLTDTAHMLMRDDMPRSAVISFLPLTAATDELAPSTFSASWTYDSYVMSFTNVQPPAATDLEGWGVYVFGSDGLLHVNRNGWMARPVRPRGRPGQAWTPGFEPFENKPAQNEGKFDVGTLRHVRNFLDCVKSRNKPNCEVEIGFQSTLPTLLALSAVRMGGAVRWDGKQVRRS